MDWTKSNQQPAIEEAELTPTIGVSGPTGSPTAEEVPKCKPGARVGACLLSSCEHSCDCKTYPSESDPVYFNESRV